MANGKKTGGRVAGTPNKLSGTAKDNIAAVFNRLGGTSAMAKWAEENPNQFYQIYAKLIPVQISGDQNAPLIHRIEREIIDPNTKD